MNNRIYRRRPKRRLIRHHGPMAAASMSLAIAVFGLTACGDNASSSTPSGTRRQLKTGEYYLPIMNDNPEKLVKTLNPSEEQRR